MKWDIRAAVLLGSMLMIFPRPAFSLSLIEFTNEVATFTNLQGQAFRQVVLVRADLDGVIWRNGVSGGRVCYTNLDPSFLERWGISTNRIDSAKVRAERKAIADARDRRVAVAEAQVQAAAKAKEEAEWQAGAAASALNDQRKVDQEAMDALQLQIDNAKTQMRRAEAIARDYNQANARNHSAPHVYIKATERVKIKEAEEQLRTMKREFALKYPKR